MSSSNVGANSFEKRKAREREDSGVSSHKDIAGFEQWIDEKDAADLAADAYSGKTVGEKVNGWTIKESIDDKRTGFKAKLFEKNGKYVFATAGTNPLSGKDWANNVSQHFGLNTEQYNLSVLKAKEYSRKYDALLFVGHSLGGGLASANSRATGRSAITFNAAALSSKYNEGFMDSKIAAYISDGDILDYINEVLSFGQKAEGTVIRRTVIASKMPNLQGVFGSGAYQFVRGVWAHCDYAFSE